MTFISIFTIAFVVISAALITIIFLAAKIVISDLVFYEKINQKPGNVVYPYAVYSSPLLSPEAYISLYPEKKQAPVIYSFLIHTGGTISAPKISGVPIVVSQEINQPGGKQEMVLATNYVWLKLQEFKKSKYPVFENFNIAGLEISKSDSTQ